MKCNQGGGAIRRLSNIGRNGTMDHQGDSIFAPRKCQKQAFEEAAASHHIRICEWALQMEYAQWLSFLKEEEKSINAGNGCEVKEAEKRFPHFFIPAEMKSKQIWPDRGIYPVRPNGLLGQSTAEGAAAWTTEG